MQELLATQQLIKGARHHVVHTLSKDREGRGHCRHGLEPCKRERHRQLDLHRRRRLVRFRNQPRLSGNQSPPTIGAYLQDLLNLSSAPHLLGQNDNYGGAILTGIGNPSAPANMFLLAFHFGNGNDYWTHTATFDAFFSCVSACDTFTLPSTKAVSNYRLYSIADGPIGPSIDPQGPAPVPEPASIALLALGLVGLGVSRFRRH